MLIFRGVSQSNVRVFKNTWLEKKGFPENVSCFKQVLGLDVARGSRLFLLGLICISKCQIDVTDLSLFI